MKLLVTGGSGFIGSNFIQYWINKYPADKITNLDKLTYAGNQENLKNLEKNEKYTFIHGDICDPKTVEEAMNDTEIVVHFAAESHVDRSIKTPAIFIETNVAGTQVLLDCAVKQKVKRFHHISTDEVFGSLSLESTEKFNEGTPYNPRSPYAASKASSDHLVRAYGETYNLNYSITNCSNNYGPYQFPEKFIPLAVVSLLTGKKVPVYGDGLYVRDWLYVEDHARAIDMIVKNEKTKNTTYCIGGLTENISNIEVIKKIIRLLGKNEDQIEYVTDRPGHDRRYAVDWSKAQKELGWNPEADFDSYLERTIEWYKKNPEWWEKVLKKDPRIYHGQ